MREREKEQKGEGEIEKEQANNERPVNSLVDVLALDHLAKSALSQGGDDFI